MATVLEIRENEKGLKESGKIRKCEENMKIRESQGILTVCLNIKVLPLLRFNLMISGSAKM